MWNYMRRSRTLRLSRLSVLSTDSNICKPPLVERQSIDYVRAYQTVRTDGWIITPKFSAKHLTSHRLAVNQKWRRKKEFTWCFDMCGYRFFPITECTLRNEPIAGRAITGRFVWLWRVNGKGGQICQPGLKTGRTHVCVCVCVSEGVFRDIRERHTWRNHQYLHHHHLLHRYIRQLAVLRFENFTHSSVRIRRHVRVGQN